MTYSVQEVEGHIVEILRRVKEGERVIFSEEGKDVAEIRPLSGSREDGLRELQERGVFGPLVKPEGTLSPMAERPGALARFLELRLRRQDKPPYRSLRPPSARA
jgi:antitoxin (DNA-binding transcriptional repressor) of toxin-antitoxin stability system